MPNPKDKHDRTAAQQQSLPLTWDADGTDAAPEHDEPDAHPRSDREEPTASANVQPADDESRPPWDTDEKAEPDAEDHHEPDAGDRDEPDDEDLDEPDAGDHHEPDGGDHHEPDDGDQDEPDTDDAQEVPDPDEADEVPVGHTPSVAASAASTVEKTAAADEDEERDGQRPAAPSGAAGGAPDVVQLKNAVETLGQRLMRARADRGLTVEEVAGRTQIRPSVVEDLESDRYDRLPVEFYCIRHIEALCREYDIDPEPVVDRFRETFSEGESGGRKGDRFSVTSLETESGSKVTYTPTSATVTVGGKRSISITGIIVSVLILLLAGLAIGAWGVQQWRSRAADEQDELTPTQEARDLTQFIVPQQLPLESMPIPKD